MVKKIFIGFVLLVGANLTETKVNFGYQAAKKEAFVPYYMTNPNSSKRNAVKTDQASDGCCSDCNGNTQGTILPKQTYINLKNANTNKSAATLITAINKA